MSREFDMSDLGKLSYYLRLEVVQDRYHIKLKQSAYAKKVIDKTGMAECNVVKFSMEYKLPIYADKEWESFTTTHYKSIVGGLRYLVHTRPNIASAVGIVSRYMERPTVFNMNVVKRIRQYMKGTLQYRLIYLKERGNNILSGFSDSDLAGSVDDRKCTAGMTFYLDDNPITWVSQKQRCVALSSCEAEFMAATAAAC
ncbi:secreted RxLR effector protein 161-like [Apium graveolens]|uniref:secreted RxLR effector protein 161-like n=1 Tax=Apium graveolens TaxID=4045 RepID=UPI003D7B98D7